MILENLEDDIDSADSSMKSMRSRMNALYAQTASSERAQWSIILCLLGERSAAALSPRQRPPWLEGACARPACLRAFCCAARRWTEPPERGNGHHRMATPLCVRTSQRPAPAQCRSATAAAP